MLRKRYVGPLRDLFASYDIRRRTILFKCLADPTCFRILYVLSQYRNVCPSDLSDILKLPLPAVSHQLAKLKTVGIVTTVRHGKTICYSLDASPESSLVKKLIAETMR